MSYVGYWDADWGMEGWYRQQEKASDMEAYFERLVSDNKEYCRRIAESIAYSYYTADDPAEFMETAGNDSWHEWLIEAADEEDGSDTKELVQAMRLICKEEEEDFTNFVWVLSQIKNNETA